MFNPQRNIPDHYLQDFKNFSHLLQTQYYIQSDIVQRIYLHWAVSPKGMLFDSYNCMVNSGNSQLKLVVTGNPQDNVAGLNSNEVHSHTWHRNTNSLGIAIDGMIGGTVNNFGPDAPSLDTLLYLCGGLAAIAKAYDVDINGRVMHGEVHIDNNGNEINTRGELNVLTHAEVAVIDSYPNERIDLGVLEALPYGVGLTSDMRTRSGDMLRECAHRIKSML